MHQLYPTLLWMPIAMQAEGRGEEYVVSILAYACKDELKQVVEDGMLIRLQFNVLLLFSSYCLILMCYFAGHYGYPEYDLPTSRIPVSAEGC